MKKFLKITVAIFVLLVGGCIGYLSIGQYHSTKALESKQDDITITQEKDYIFFDGEGSDEALIFYTGAKVDADAYSDLAIALAKEHVDVFILESPFNFALLTINKADKIIEQFDYKHYIIGGHSLGGVVAGMYLDSHPDKIDGLLLLASYANNEIPDHIKVLSLYGSNDGVMNMDKLEETVAYLPPDNYMVCIYGGNHAGFGNYGSQKGDYKSAITSDQQIHQTVEYFTEFFLENN